MKRKCVLHWALHTRIYKWVPIRSLWLKKSWKAHLINFLTGSHGRWPSIRNRIVISDIPNISEVSTEISRTYQPKGIILCGVTALIDSSHLPCPKCFCRFNRHCLFSNKSMQRKREIKKWWQARRYLLIVKGELGWSGGILEGSFRFRSSRGSYTVPAEERLWGGPKRMPQLC